MIPPRSCPRHFLERQHVLDTLRNLARRMHRRRRPFLKKAMAAYNKRKFRSTKGSSSRLASDSVRPIVFSEISKIP